MMGEDLFVDDGGVEMRAAVTAIEAKLAIHPGTVAKGYFVELQRAWGVHQSAWTNIYALMVTGETDDEMKLGLLKWDGDQKAPFTVASDAALNAYCAALGSLIDITRRVIQKQSADLRKKFETERSDVLNVDGAEFLRSLRNYLLHYGHPPWVFRGESSSGSNMECLILMDPTKLLVWDGWSADAKKYIESQTVGVRLSVILPIYQSAMAKLYMWLFVQLLDSHSDNFDAMNVLIGERNLALTGGLFADQESFMAHVQKGVDEWHKENPDD